MGKGPLERTLYTPTHISLLDQVKFKTQNRDYPWWKKIPQLYVPNQDGYRAHLQVLSIALEGEMYGKICKDAFSRLNDQHKRKPSNPLFASVLAKFDEKKINAAIHALKNPIIDDYSGGKNGEIMQKIDRLFAVNYLIR